MYPGRCARFGGTRVDGKQFQSRIVSAQRRTVVRLPGASNAASAARTSSLTRVTVQAVGAVRGVVHARQVPDRGQQVLRRSAPRNGRLESCVLRLDRCRSQVGHVPTARDAPSRALPFTNVPHIAHHRRACSRRTCHEANRHSRCEIRAPRRPIGRDMKDVSPKSDLARAALDRYLRDHAG